MARKTKMQRDESETRDRDRKRDRAGWKAQRQAARRAKRNRHAFETGEKD